MAPGSQDTFSEQKMCTNCHKTDSSETWRVVKNLTYCNACGIYLRDHNIQRPQRLVEQSAARRATKRALQPEPSRMASLQGSQGSSDSLRRTQSALAPAIVRSLQDNRTLSGFALQGYSTYEDLLDSQPSLPDFTEELRRSKRSRTRSPILDDILEDEVIEEPSRRARTPNLDDEDRAPGPRTDGSQSGSDVSAETPYARCMSHGEGAACEEDQGCVHMLSSLSEAEQAEIAAGCLLYMKAVALDTLQQADLTRASRRVNVYLSSKICHNCGTTNTPLWRKYQGLDMCNACGVYPTQREHPGAMRDPTRAVKPKGPGFKAPSKSGPIRTTSGPNTPRGWITAYKPEDEPVPDLPQAEQAMWRQ